MGELADDFAAKAPPLADRPVAGQIMARSLLIAAAALLLGVQLYLAVAMAINWDEFYFLAQVHAHARGDLDLAVNTFHVQLFRWLPDLPGDEVDQIVAGRLVMWLLAAATAAMVVAIGRQFFPLDAALGAALVYLSFGAVIAHGASFRTDPISTFLLMTALALMVGRRLGAGRAVVLGALVALAGLVTIKSAFYLPSLAAAAAWRLRTSPEPRRVVADLALALGAGCAVFAGLFLWHRSTLAAAGLAGAMEMATSSYRKTVADAGAFPRWPDLRSSLLHNPIQWALIVTGLGLVARRTADRERESWRWMVVLGFALPLATLAFYRNAFPYFYAFLLAPACLPAAAVFEGRRSEGPVRIAVIVALLTTAGLHFATYVQRHQHLQRAVVRTVHGMFPAPVPYIDRAYMVASFPMAGFFMTSWGVEQYRAAGRPVLNDQAADRPPAFLIVGHPAQAWALSGQAPPPGSKPLLPEDARFLRANFIPHWGPIWVAGRRLRLSEAEQGFELDIPGTYTVESERPVRLDGRWRRPGALVTLARGRHTAGPGRGELTLRWGDRLRRPQRAPPPGPLYWGF